MIRRSKLSLELLDLPHYERLSANVEETFEELSAETKRANWHSGISPKNLSLLNASPFSVSNAEPSRVRQP